MPGTYLVFHHDRSPITMGEVTDIVAPYGNLAYIEPLRPDFAAILDLPYAMYVEFTEFDCDRDLVNVSLQSHFSSTGVCLTSYSATVATVVTAS